MRYFVFALIFLACAPEPAERPGVCLDAGSGSVTFRPCDSFDDEDRCYYRFLGDSFVALEDDVLTCRDCLQDYPYRDEACAPYVFED